MEPIKKTWRRVEVTTVREASPAPYKIDGPDSLAKVLRMFIGEDPRENMVAAYLDTRHQMIALHTVSIGTADSTTCNPREILGPAVALSAVSIVIAHNHPSGDPTPSAEDIKFTERMRQACEIIGIPLLDHIVIGSQRYYAFSDCCFRAY